MLNFYKQELSLFCVENANCRYGKHENMKSTTLQITCSNPPFMFRSIYLVLFIDTNVTVLLDAVCFQLDEYNHMVGNNIELARNFLRFLSKFLRRVERALEVSILRLYKGSSSIFPAITESWIWTLITSQKRIYHVKNSEYFCFMNLV